MTPKRYTVIENTPGYLPECEPAEFDSWTLAIDYAESLVSQLKEQGYKLDTKVFNFPHYAEFILFCSRTDLGRVIEVNGYGYN